jgi:two-component system, NtrC family, sensor kinase
MNSVVTNKPIVLIVDDNVANIEVLGAALTNDYEIHFATGGAEGIDLATRVPPDLILLDVMMPDMDGFETCRCLRTNVQLRDTPVIFISALDAVTDKVRAFQAGGNDYVTKPFQPEEVHARVATHVALYRTRRDLHEREEKLRQNLDELERAHARLKEMSSQLLQSEKLASIGQLAAGVAHEINNPIGFVNSNLGTLKTYVEQLLGLLDEYALLEPEAPPPLRQRIDEAKKRADLDFLRGDLSALIVESMDGAARVRRIVQDLRDFSRPGDSEWQEVDLHAGLESTLNVVANEIKYKADVVREYGNLPLIDGLPFQLNQVFLNLLVNAAQAIAERGTITLRTACEGDWVYVAVTDTGSGMTPETRDHIFEPFFTTKPVGKGTGLGLSVAYGIIEKHGGRVDVSSEPGKGTTFTVWLPVSRATSQKA